MYIPKYFEETRIDVLHDFIRTNSFGALVALSDSGLEANHLPFLLDSESGSLGTLKGHLARANPTWQHFNSNVDVLVLFQGPHAYISPDWYPSKHETGRAVPTWNYMVVHAQGVLRVIDDPVWLRSHVEALTNLHEEGREKPWKVADAPADYLNRMTQSIVGIELPVTKLVGKWKLSQNRSASDRKGVVDGLLREGRGDARAIAEFILQGGCFP